MSKPQDANNPLAEVLSNTTHVKNNQFSLGNGDSALVLRDSKGDTLQMEAMLPADFDGKAPIDLASPAFLIFLFSLLLSNQPKYNKVLASLYEAFEEDMSKSSKDDGMRIEISPEKQTLQ